MSASFFPAPEPEPEQVRPEVPPWFQPPADEYPARVLVREFLARTERTSLAVSHVDVYSTGLRIAVDWDLRREGETAAEWQLSTGFGGFRGPGVDTESVLRYGLALADGSVVTTVDRFRRYEAIGRRPEGWSLMDHMSGSGGDDTRYSGSSRLWLWPLPPAGPIEVVAEWRARGIPESRLVLDGSLLLAAVGGVRPLWG